MQTGSVTVDPYLQSELKPGEQLLWWGRPDPARRVKNRNMNTSYITYGVTSAFWILLVFFNLYLLTLGNDPFALLLLIAAVLLLALNLYRIYVVYTQSHKSMATLARTIYGITNQRIIVMTASDQGFAVKSHTQKDIGQILRVETGEGWGEVTYGIPYTRQVGRRVVTIADKLTGIPNARMVEDILIRTFKNAAPDTQWTPYPQQTPPTSYPPAPQQYMPPQASSPSYPPAPQQYMPPQAPQE